MSDGQIKKIHTYEFRSHAVLPNQIFLVVNKHATQQNDFLLHNKKCVPKSGGKNNTMSPPLQKSGETSPQRRPRSKGVSRISNFINRWIVSSE